MQKEIHTGLFFYIALSDLSATFNLKPVNKYFVPHHHHPDVQRIRRHHHYAGTAARH